MTTTTRPSSSCASCSASVTQSPAYVARLLQQKAGPISPRRACRSYAEISCALRYARAPSNGETWNTSCRSSVTKDVHALTVTVVARTPAGTPPFTGCAPAASASGWPMFVRTPTTGWRGIAPFQREGGQVAVSGHSSTRICQARGTMASDR